MNFVKLETFVKICLFARELPRDGAMVVGNAMGVGGGDCGQ